MAWPGSLDHPLEISIEMSLIFFTSQRWALRHHVLKFMPGSSLEIFVVRILTLALYENGQIEDCSYQIGANSNTKKESITCFLRDVSVCGNTHFLRLRIPFPQVPDRMCQIFGMGLLEAYLQGYFQSPVQPITRNLQNSQTWAHIQGHLPVGLHDWMDGRVCCSRYAHLNADFRLALPVIASENANWMILRKILPPVLLCLFGR